MTIELKAKNGKDIILSAVKKSDSDNQYELVDSDNKVCMVLELSDHNFIVIDQGEIIEDSDALQAKLNDLVLMVIEQEQSGVESSETEQQEDQSPYDPDKIKVHAKQFNVKLIEEMIDHEDIDFTPDFQRNFVWNTKQKSKLIESILLRIPLPMFYFAEDEEGRLTIVDGLQRITTIKEFMENKFPLTHLEYLNEGVSGRYYKSDPETGREGLSPKYLRWFNMTQFSVNVIDPASPPKVKYDIFRRINTGGRRLNNQEIRNCLASRNLRELLKRMTNLEEFISATDGSIKPTRMEDLEVALRFITFHRAYLKDQTLEESYNGKMEPTLDDMTEELGKLPVNQLREYVGLFSNAMNNAEYLLGSRYAFRKVSKKHLGPGANKQLINKALFVALSVLLSDINPIALKEKVAPGYLLNSFAELLETDSTLMYYLSYGTNGKANLEYIFKTLKGFIDSHIKI